MVIEPRRNGPSESHSAHREYDLEEGNFFFSVQYTLIIPRQLLESPTSTPTKIDNLFLSLSLECNQTSKTIITTIINKNKQTRTGQNKQAEEK